ARFPTRRRPRSASSARTRRAQAAARTDCARDVERVAGCGKTLPTRYWFTDGDKRLDHSTTPAFSPVPPNHLFFKRFATDMHPCYDWVPCTRSAPHVSRPDIRQGQRLALVPARPP